MPRYSPPGKKLDFNFCRLRPGSRRSLLLVIIRTGHIVAARSTDQLAAVLLQLARTNWAVHRSICRPGNYVPGRNRTRFRRDARSGSRCFFRSHRPKGYSTSRPLRKATPFGKTAVTSGAGHQGSSEKCENDSPGIGKSRSVNHNCCFGARWKPRALFKKVFP